MSLEDQLFENMPTKSIKFIDQVINTSLKNEDEEKNRTFLWKNDLKTGNIDRETINKINEKNEHILGFIFKSIRNNNHNKLEINNEYIGLGKFCKNITKTITPKLLEKLNLKFITNIDDSLVHKLIFVDKIRLEQILINFIFNSIKFTPVKDSIL